MSHFQEVCQFGEIHAQCRCPGYNKYTEHIKCTVPEVHSKPKSWFVMTVTNPNWTLQNTKDLLNSDPSDFSSWWSKKYRTFEEAIASIKNRTDNHKFHIVKVEL